MVDGEKFMEKNEILQLLDMVVKEIHKQYDIENGTTKNAWFWTVTMSFGVGFYLRMA